MFDFFVAIHLIDHFVRSVFKAKFQTKRLNAVTNKKRPQKILCRLMLFKFANIVILNRKNGRISCICILHDVVSELFSTYTETNPQDPFDQGKTAR